jgi:hypothetical protein
MGLLRSCNGFKSYWIGIRKRQRPISNSRRRISNCIFRVCLIKGGVFLKRLKKLKRSKKW